MGNIFIRLVYGFEGMAFLDELPDWLPTRGFAQRLGFVQAIRGRRFAAGAAGMILLSQLGLEIGVFFLKLGENIALGLVLCFQLTDVGLKGFLPAYQRLQVHSRMLRLFP